MSEGLGRRALRRALRLAKRVAHRVAPESVVVELQEIRHLHKEIRQLREHRHILGNAFVAAKVLGPAPAEIVVRKEERGWSNVPPAEMWEGYGGSPEDHLLTGERDTAAMLAAIEEHVPGFQIERVLDFGCAAGRMIRAMPGLVENVEAWGTDIKASSIRWCQANLPSTLHFTTNSTFPYLPFEDGYFDLVYAGSVFTHIVDFADSWFLELRRITRPGGLLFLTVVDSYAIGLHADDPNALYWLGENLRSCDARTGVLSSDFDFFSTSSPGAWEGLDVPQVFYDDSYLEQWWGGLTEIVASVHGAYGFQTAMLLRKHA